MDFNKHFENLNNRQAVVKHIIENFVCQTHKKPIDGHLINVDYTINYNACCPEFYDIIEFEIRKHQLPHPYLV